MKTRLLSGLTALLLGGLTSCSNILEENGVINNVAESGMGELRINLLQDETVIVDTKAIKDAGTGYTISVQPKGESAKTYTYNGSAMSLNLAEGMYEISAYNMPDFTKNFAWNEPYYKTAEVESLNIEKGSVKTVNLTCTRANSTLIVDTTGFKSDGNEKVLYVQSLMAYEGDESTDGFNLLKKDDNTIPSIGDSVCVKAGIKARIELVPAKMADGAKLSPVTTYISSDQSAPEPTKAAKRYKVSYTVNDKNGQASITITVNDSVEEVKIPTVEIDPYKNTTSETQSN